MLDNINLIRNIGKFSSVDSGSQLNLQELALIYAENGRGKTTLASILRSLGSQDSLPIIQRKRLGGQGEPHVVITDSNSSRAVFQDGSWNETLFNILVFDDHFVTDNIYAGTNVETGHRQNLHELIIGAEGVALNARLQSIVSRIERHNQVLRERGAQITSQMRYGLSVDQFCALQNSDSIDSDIEETERALSAGRKAAAIAQRNEFVPLAIPNFEMETLGILLSRVLPDIEATALEQVQNHIDALGEGSESWVGDGVNMVNDGELEDCPFCQQDLNNSQIISLYQSFFNQEYLALKEEVASALANLRTNHRTEVLTAFERNVRRLSDDRQFWAEFIQVPELNIDTAAITQSWRSSFEAFQSLLNSKMESPLEIIRIDTETEEIISQYNLRRNALSALNTIFQEANQEVQRIKESSAASNISTLEADLNRLRAIKSRYTEDIILLCDNYTSEITLKNATEIERTEARAALDDYRNRVFPQYQEAINRYLGRFNAGYRLDNVSSVNNRGGSSCNYNVLIENIAVPISTSNDSEPSFKTTLSSGDRNALALAFFFASIEMNPSRESLIVIIDDPMTSLDDHRTLTTIQQIRELVPIVEQVIVLSHSKPFLCNLWTAAQNMPPSSMKITRSGSSSTLSNWDVRADSITEHDRNYALVTDFIENGNDENERQIAFALRPMLEAFVRVTCPNIFPPGSLLGPFIGRCQQRENTPNQVFPEQKRVELRSLLDYANQFHHDTNPAWQTQIINDQELLGYSRRTISFINL
ncbi:AAA family ATPase [Cellulophaga sp. L1A9]|uniref:AAA family ATPase n=1 Tax=Cellulophaga sp. L1A9 TaxID=2686362 RepID=UPI00131CE171|nr:AAA family ATPase [Cellulophaga sp. L1A9]